MRPRARFATLIAVAVIFVPPARAQSGKSTATTSRPGATPCQVDSGAAWFRKQREWLDDSRHEWSNDTLRASLLRAAALNGSAPLAVQLGVFVVGRDADPPVGETADTAIAQLRRLGRGSIAPTKSVVGAAGTRAVWLLSLRDTALARASLHRMMEAGPVESFSADVATLEDRMRLLNGRKQLNGTQFRLDDAGHVVLAPMEDSAHADLRREEALLPPLKVGLCLAKQR